MLGMFIHSISISLKWPVLFVLIYSNKNMPAFELDLNDNKWFRTTVISFVFPVLKYVFHLDVFDTSILAFLKNSFGGTETPIRVCSKWSRANLFFGFNRNAWARRSAKYFANHANPRNAIRAAGPALYVLHPQLSVTPMETITENVHKTTYIILFICALH